MYFLIYLLCFRYLLVVCAFCLRLSYCPYVSYARTLIIKNLLFIYIFIHKHRHNFKYRILMLLNRDIWWICVPEYATQKDCLFNTACIPKTLWIISGIACWKQLETVNSITDRKRKFVLWKAIVTPFFKGIICLLQIRTVICYLTIWFRGFLV